MNSTELVLRVLKEAGQPMSAKEAYVYARDVLKGPFPAGEAAIATDTSLSYDYARDVLKGPFPAGEARISKSTKYRKLYLELITASPEL